MGIYERHMESAELGNAKAQFLIGDCYYRGNGVAQDDAKALHWWLKVFEQGHAEARSRLGLDLCDEMEVEEGEPRTAEFEFLKSAAEAGDALSQLGLGQVYLNGTGVIKNVNAAVKWWLKAAEQGHAQVEVVSPSIKDRVSRSYAGFWASSAVGSGEEKFHLGLLYFKGEFVQKSMDLAVYWWKRAAKQEFPDALYNLGVCHRDGDGLEQSHEKAVLYWLKAAELGHGDACYNLGLSYDAGKGVGKDPEKAIEWWRKASKLGAGGPEKFDVEDKYSDNLKVEAQKIMQEAESGDSAAQFQLGFLYLNGAGVRKDTMMTVHWWHKAADQGHIVAQYNLGGLYFSGKLDKSDIKKALLWWEKAAEQGLDEAQFRVGLCYAEGQGTDKNLEKMKYWWMLSAEQGNEKAIDELKAIDVD